MNTRHRFPNLQQGLSLVETALCVGCSDCSFSCLIKAGFKASRAWILKADVRALSMMSKSSTGGKLCLAASKTKVMWPLLEYGGTWNSLNYCLSLSWFDLSTWSYIHISLWDSLMGHLTLRGDLVEILPAQPFPHRNYGSVKSIISSYFFLVYRKF